MQQSQSTEKIIRYALGILLLFLALNAFGGGYYGMAGAKDVPLEWLEGSPFSNYFIPSLLLFAVVGSSALLAAIAVLGRHYLAVRAALISAVIVLIWLTVQISIIGYISWMQPVTATAAVLILFLTWLLNRYNAATTG